MAKKKESVEEPLEKQLWKAADKLRKNIDAAEYKHVVLGLIFLKYISVSFEELYQKLMGEVAEGADPEDREEYKAENVFFVPADARWTHIVSKAKDPQIGKYVDEAMDAIEKENSSLKGVLPKVFARQIRKIERNIKRKMYSLCLPMLVGHISYQRQKIPKLVNMLMKQWMLSRKKTPR